MDIQSIWPGAFSKGDSVNDNAVVEYYFIMDGGRYPFDQVSRRLGFYQYDTPQDAWYFGLWVNPETLRIVSYVEGDITVMEAHDRASYDALLNDWDALNRKMNPSRPGGVDNTDGKYYEKLPEGAAV